MMQSNSALLFQDSNGVFARSHVQRIRFLRHKLRVPRPSYVPHSLFRASPAQHCDATEPPFSIQQERSRIKTTAQENNGNGTEAFYYTFCACAVSCVLGNVANK